VYGGGVEEEGRSSDFSEENTFLFSRSLYSAKNKKPKTNYGEFLPSAFYLKREA
jgi:hypothetical protein